MARQIDLPAIAQLWAKMHIADLEDRFRIETDAKESIKNQIIEIAVKHSLLTRFTAFVVVDESEIVNAGGERRKIVQPVEMPARWEMEMSPDMGLGTVYGASGGLGYGSVAPVGLSRALKHKPAQPPTFGAPAQSLPWAEAPAPCAQSASARASAGRSGADLAAFVDALKEKFSPEDKRAGQAIQKAFDEFAKVFEEAWQDVEAGKLPPAAALEKDRNALLKALADPEVGTEFPGTQRFLRTAAVELVAALRSPGASVTTVRPVFDRHKESFEKACEEISKVLAGGGGSANKGAFWDSTV